MESRTAPATELIKAAAKELRLPESGVSWAWRMLRQNGHVRPGKRGPYGGPADAEPWEASKLIMALIFEPSKNAAASAIDRIEQLESAENFGITLTESIQLPKDFLSVVAGLIYYLSDPKTRDRILEFAEAVGLSAAGSSIIGWIRVAQGSQSQPPGRRTLLYSKPGDQEEFSTAPIIRRTELSMHALAEIARVFGPKETLARPKPEPADDDEPRDGHPESRKRHSLRNDTRETYTEQPSSR